MISSIELNDNAKNLNVKEFYEIILLISIYQSYVILNHRNQAKTLDQEHHLYKDFFKIGERERVKLQEWLINAKRHLEIHNPVNCPSQSSDILVVSVII
jgi:hypothetical protein